MKADRKINGKKSIAITLSAVLLLGGVGRTGFALAAGSDKNDVLSTDSSEEMVAQVGDDLQEALQTGNGAGQAGTIAKDETVYVMANADGKVQKIIVNDWLKDSEGKDLYSQSDLMKELPVDMSVSYKLDGKTISPELLAGKSGKVTIRFDYTNHQYESVEIAGKQEKIYVPFAIMTGLVLDNDIFTDVEVTNGKLINDGSRTVIVGLAFPGMQENLGIEKEKLEIPDYVEITADVKDFALGMTITMTTNELFNQSNQLVEKDPDSLMDLDASMEELTSACDQLMDGSDQLYEGLCTLLEKSGELVDGIDKLAAGAGELKKGSGELDAGVGQLQNGAGQLSEGLSTLASKNAELNGGAAQVFNTLLATATNELQAAGLTVPEMTISNYAEVLNGIIFSLDESNVYSQALQQVTAAVEAQRENIRMQVKAAVEEQVTEAVTAKVRAAVEEKVTAAVKQAVETRVTEAVKEAVTAKVTAAVRETVENQVYQTVTGVDKATFLQSVSDGDAQIETIRKAVNSAIEEQMATEAVQAQIVANIDSQMKTDEVQGQIATGTEAQMGTEEIFSQITANTEAQMTTDEVQGQIAAATEAQMGTDEVAKVIEENTELQVQKAIADNMAGETVQSKLLEASEGAKSVIALKASLDGYNSFYLGLQAYTAGVAEAAGGAATLKSGVDELKSGSGKLNAGMGELYAGTCKLQNGAPALMDGVTQLRDGSLQLSEGLKEFYEQGIRKLTDFVKEDLDGVKERLQATARVSGDYKSFSGIHEGADEEVKFLYRTEEIQ